MLATDRLARNLSADVSSRDSIRISESDFSGRERDYLLDCLSRNWITQGYYVRRFEEAFAESAGVRYAVACSSGTAALHLAMLALGVSSEDAVIVPSLTYVATANAARYCGARVKFCDVNADDWCMDYETYLDLTAHNKIIALPVHLYDSVCPTYRGMVEDASHLAPSNRQCDLSTYSFYGSKLITTGEGGMVTTNHEDVANTLRLYRGQGVRKSGSYYHIVLGYNYRMTDMQAAVGLAQLERLPETLARRRRVINRYRSNLANCSSITLQGGQRASGWMMAVLLPRGSDRDTIAAKLSQLTPSIETRPFFEPLHTLPMYRRADVTLPVAEDVAARGLCLPTHMLLADADVDYVCERLMEVVKCI